MADLVYWSIWYKIQAKSIAWTTSENDLHASNFLNSFEPLSNL